MKRVIVRTIANKNEIVIPKEKVFIRNVIANREVEALKKMTCEFCGNYTYHRLENGFYRCLFCGKYSQVKPSQRVKKAIEIFRERVR